MEATNFPITHWSEDDKPREKMMLKGKSALSDAELVAILIGSGSRNESAVGLSKRILASVNNNLSSFCIGSILSKLFKPIRSVIISGKHTFFQSNFTICY